jgi:hypothetical protein
MQDCDAPADAVNTRMTSIERAIAAAGMGYTVFGTDVASAEVSLW